MHHTIEKLRVTAGFLSGIELELVDGLNCIIGARGTGKTTALELIRYALGQMPDQRTDTTRFRAIEALVKGNLNTGRILVDVRTKTGLRYMAERGFGDTVQVTDETGAAVPVQLDREINADVFSQSQIEDIALDSAAQLVLLDRFFEADASTIALDLGNLMRDIDATAIDLRRLDDELVDLTNRASEVAALEAKLKRFALTDGPGGEATNAAHAAKTARDREATIASHLLQATNQVADTISVAVQSYRTVVAAHLDPTVRTGLNGEPFTVLDVDLQPFDRVLTTASSLVAEGAATAAAAIQRHGAVIADRHAAQEVEFRKVLAKSEVEGARAVERSIL